MSRQPKERVIPRQMRVVRYWLEREGTFCFYIIYSDGAIQSTTKKEATQYAKAYNTEVETRIGKPEEYKWTNTTGK